MDTWISGQGVASPVDPTKSGVSSSEISVLGKFGKLMGRVFSPVNGHLAAKAVEIEMEAREILSPVRPPLPTVPRPKIPPKAEKIILPKTPPPLPTSRPKPRRTQTLAETPSRSLHLATIIETIQKGIQTLKAGLKDGVPQARGKIIESAADPIAETTVKVEDVATDIIKYVKTQGQAALKQVARGAAKVVLVVLNEQGETVESRVVIYQPTKDSKRRELQLESDTSISLKKDLDGIRKQEKSEDFSQNLVVIDRSQEITDKTGKDSYVTEKGLGSVDGYLLKNSSLKYDTTKELARGVLAGMVGIHETGRVHGDLKPDNILVFSQPDKDAPGQQKLLAKVSDYGKMQKIGKDEARMHTGNPRFAAPEGVISQKAEVYSTALVMLSILEAETLATPVKTSAEQPLPEVSHRFGKFTETLGRQFGFIKPQRRGIEEFLVTNPSCPQKEVTSIQGKITVYGRGGVAAYVRRPTLASLKPAEEAVHGYIDATMNVLERQYDLAQLEDLKKLFKQMTLSDPAKRPTMKVALKAYDMILNAK